MAYEKIAVIGAGIGGLTVALALTRPGVRCEVFERSRSLPGIGGGLQLSPNAVAVLRRLGLGGALAGAARPVARELRRWQDNEIIARTELGAAAEQRYGSPYLTLRRSTLSRALVEACRGVQTIHFGRKCTGLRVSDDGVEIELDDGSRSHADAVVGADGLHSFVRGQVHRDTVRYSGNAVYRAVLPADRARWLCSPARVTVWLGPGRHCVCYPVDGGRSLNLVATVPAAQPPTSVREVGASEVLAAYAGWHPALRGLLAVAGRFEQHGLFDRPALPSWHQGRLVLLGDAAHPMLPFVAQGAAQAIEDAEALAHHLDFARYTAERSPRVARVAAVAQAGLHDYHLSDGPEQQARDGRLRESTVADQDWLYTDQLTGANR